MHAPFHGGRVCNDIILLARTDNRIFRVICQLIVTLVVVHRYAAVNLSSLCMSLMQRYRCKASVDIPSAIGDAPSVLHSPTPSVEEIFSPETMHMSKEIAGKRPMSILAQARLDHLYEAMQYVSDGLGLPHLPLTAPGTPQLDTGEADVITIEQQIEQLHATLDIAMNGLEDLRWLLHNSNDFIHTTILVLGHTRQYVLNHE
jgi:hypothetical protein